VDVRLIEVPYMAGDDRHGAAEGPRRLLRAGVEGLVASRGIGVDLERVDRGAPFRDTASSSAAVNRQLAAAVRRAVAADRLPCVLAGSCVAALGVLAGFAHAGCGAIWLDAHADFNTPESTASGFFPGMSAAIVAGHCYRDYWAGIGDATPLAGESIVMLGVRDLSPPAERDRVRRSGIAVVPWRGGEPGGDVEAALDGLAARVEEVYLHLDLDVLDPAVAPGVADKPVLGGMSLEDAEAVVRAAAARFRLRAATVATLTPERDRDDRTLRAALHLVGLIADWAAATRG
jgi:arginase